MKVNFTANGIYDDSVEGRYFWDESGAKACIDALSVSLDAASLPASLYLGFTSNSNSFVSLILSEAGITAPALIGGPPNALGWGQPVIPVPILPNPVRIPVRIPVRTAPAGVRPPSGRI
jgi:hypothetical protein